MQADNDLIIIHKIQAGDKNSFALLLDKYHIKIQHLIFRFVKNESIAQELAQDTFVKIYRSLENFRAESAFYTWAYRIAVNIAKTWLINNKIYQVSLNDEENDETFNVDKHLIDNDNPENQLINKQTIHIVQQAIDSMPHDLCIALTLREVDGLNYEEIATIMECPVGTVRSRIFRAREALSKALNKHNN